MTATTTTSSNYGTSLSNDAVSNGDKRAAATITQGDDKSNNNGSSVWGAVFNLTKSIVGAGVTGLGGAFARSGGIISVIGILFFGVLSKLSFDLLIELSIQTTTRSNQKSSYEDLGYAAAGTTGRTIVVLCKGLYTFGSMVAYIVIVKDNFASAASHLMTGTAGPSLLQRVLLDENATAILISTLVILPLCLLRDLKPLETFSLTGILTIVSVIAIVIYLYATTETDAHHDDDHYASVYVHWFQIRRGLLQSLGTFVFTFIAQHTVHLTFESLRPDIRDLEHWQLVSSLSAFISTAIALLAGVFVYMTFWLNAKSSMFALYPSSPAIDVAKILLTFMISLTYPLCLLACREILIVSLISISTTTTSHVPARDDETTALLLQVQDNMSTAASLQRTWLLPGQERQLTRGYHVLITVTLWSLTLFLALVAPSFGDVLNLVGCAMGTAIAFILPAVFSFALVGYTHKAAFILAVGCPIGILGTYFSFLQLVTDAQSSSGPTTL